METSRENFKQTVMESMRAVEGLRIFKARTPDDDGWQFFAAPGVAEARKMAGGRDVCAASHQDLIMLAARALTGA